MNIEERYGLKEMERDYGILTFGNALEAHRKCEELSLKDFAKILGISSSSLCDIEKGRRIPSPRRAAKIAKNIGEPEIFWIRLSLQDMLNKEHLNYTVSVA
ncbi:MAG: helix-turn-helix transcriptional regulator [Desulfobacula sp.]|nr:helix-turn-helix transcriptional regulator [Desulfobacula sp.]